MFKKKILLSLLAASAVFATDLKFYGGLQDIKGDSDHLKTFEIKAEKADSNAIAGNIIAGYKKGGDYTIGNVDAVAGYQLGSPSNEAGAFQILPLGLGYTYAKNRYIQERGKLHILKYKGGAEYKKDDFLAPNVYLNLGAYYTRALKTTASYGGYKTAFKSYKPSGYELEAEIGYRFSNNVLAGVNIGYTDINDDVNGNKVYLEKGMHAKLMVGYRF